MTVSQTDFSHKFKKKLIDNTKAVYEKPYLNKRKL